MTPLLERPLHQVFLADARTCAREGRSGHVREALALALDFAGAEDRRAVAVAASELLATQDGVVSLPPEPAPRTGRGEWRRRGLRDAPAYPARARMLTAALAIVALVAAAGRGAYTGSWKRSRPALERAARHLDRGDANEALRLLRGYGAAAPARVWLLRASAHEHLADTLSAVGALASAAAADAEGGRWAMQAGDRLSRLGAAEQAADAYLFALSPRRTGAEVDRIVRAQKAAGLPARVLRMQPPAGGTAHESM